MAIETSAFMLGIALIFIYFVVYKKNNFFGNVLYILTGLTTMYFGTGLALVPDQRVHVIVGGFIFIGGIINMVYDMTKKLGS